MFSISHQKVHSDSSRDFLSTSLHTSENSNTGPSFPLVILIDLSHIAPNSQSCTCQHVLFQGMSASVLRRPSTSSCRAKLELMACRATENGSFSSTNPPLLVALQNMLSVYHKGKRESSPFLCSKGARMEGEGKIPPHSNFWVPAFRGKRSKRVRARFFSFNIRLLAFGLLFSPILGQSNCWQVPAMVQALLMKTLITRGMKLHIHKERCL